MSVTSKTPARRRGTASGNVGGESHGGFRMAVRPFAAEWRDRAVAARDLLADARAAQIIENLIADLERFATNLDSELLTPEASVEWSGYSVDHLARLCREGKLRNYGRKGRPLYARSELPRKASKAGALRSAQRSDIVPVTRQQIARAAITPFVGGRDG